MAGGLSMAFSSQTAAAAAAASAAASAVVSTVLDPTDLLIWVKQDAARMDVTIDGGSCVLKLSPQVAALILALQGVLLRPLSAPPPEKPLARVSVFDRIWSSHDRSANTLGHAHGQGGSADDSASTLPVTVASLGQGGVDPMAQERGVTVWRPQVPFGYVSLGDVLTPGTSLCSSCHAVCGVLVSGMAA